MQCSRQRQNTQTPALYKCSVGINVFINHAQIFLSIEVWLGHRKSLFREEDKHNLQCHTWKLHCLPPQCFQASFRAEGPEKPLFEWPSVSPNIRLRSDLKKSPSNSVFSAYLQFPLCLDKSIAVSIHHQEKVFRLLVRNLSRYLICVRRLFVKCLCCL